MTVEMRISRRADAEKFIHCLSHAHSLPLSLSSPSLPSFYSSSLSFSRIFPSKRRKSVEKLWLQKLLLELLHSCVH